MLNLSLSKMFNERRGFDLLKFIPTRFYDGDQGAAGGASSPAPGDGGAGGDPVAIDVLEGIPKSIIDSDPELKKFSGKEEDTAGEGSGDEDNDGTDDVKGGESDDGKPDDSGTGEEGDGKKEGEDADDKNSGTDDNLSDVEFADDVIKGLKAEHLKSLPKEALAAIAEFHGEHTVLADEAAKAKESLAKLLDDPVVKRREALLKSGKQDFEVRGISEEEKRGLLSKIVEKVGLSQEEAESVFSIFKNGIDDVIKEAANDTIQNLLLKDEHERRNNEIQKKGRQIFLTLGKFNKNLVFKETDASKFWKDDGSLNEKHPEANVFQEKIIPIMNSLAKANMSYDSLVKLSEEFGEEAVYAMAAKKLGLPVAINTADRDKKIVASELRKKLAPFLKGSSVSELQSKGGSSAPSDGKSKESVIKHGYDIMRLATDKDYYDSAMTKKGANREHMEMIDALADEGEALLSRKGKLKK